MNQQVKLFTKSILIVVWFYVASLLVSNVILFYCGDFTKYDSLMKKHSNLISIILYVLIFLGIILVDKHREAFFYSFKTLKLKHIAKYMIMGLGAYWIGMIITHLLIGFFPEYNQIGNSFTEYEPILRFFAMVILPPIVEEYLFRYKIQGYLKEGFGTTIAIIGQAVLFGMLHHYMLQKIYATVLGGIFGYLKEKKGTIQCSLWMHVTINFLGWIIGCFFLT